MRWLNDEDARTKSEHDGVLPLLLLGALGDLALKKGLNAVDTEVSRRNAEVISALRPPW
jgi:hypothetical protein